MLTGYVTGCKSVTKVLNFYRKTFDIESCKNSKSEWKNQLKKFQK